MNEKNSRRILAFALSFAIVSATSFSLAYATDAKDLIARGVQARREGKDQQALSLFEEALRQSPTPQAAAQLGLCEQALGLWMSAETHLQQALKGTDDPWMKKHQSTLQASLEVVQQKIGAVEIWGTPAGASVVVDGTTAGRFPLPQALHLAEGRHAITVQAPNHIAEDRVLIVRAGTLSREHVALAPAGPLVPPPPQRTSTDAPRAPSPSTRQGDEPEESVAAVPTLLPTWRRVLPWTLLVGALAAGAVGAWEHVSWNRDVDRFNTIMACGRSAPMRGSDPSCAGLYDDFSKARIGAMVGYGVAGVLAAGAATLFILNAGKSSDGGETTVGIQLGSDRTWLFCTTTLTL